MLSQRWAVDKPVPWFWKNEDGARRLSWPEGARFWFGLFYQIISNFGRSTLRPVLCWLVVTWLFAGLYFAAHLSAASAAGRAANSDPSCIAGEGDPVSEALHLSFEKGLVFGGLADPNRSYQTRACLFGLTRVQQPQTELRSFAIPNTPSLAVALGAFQSALSAALIFLFLMAVRNEFRIK